MPETYIVTGGAGFIGSHLAERLLKEGQRVRIIDNFSTGKRANIAALVAAFPDALEVYEVSITDGAAIAPIFKGVDYVFHQAALASVPRSIDDPVATNEANVHGTLNVLVASRDADVKRVAYAASSSAYGEVTAEYQVETMQPHPLSPYGVSKLAGEYYCQAFTQVYGLETVALRYFNVFGPRQDETSQYSAVIPKFISTMLAGKAPTIYGDGEQSRDFTYIDNVVHGNLLALKAPGVGGEMMNLATGGSVSLLQLVEKINRLLDTSIEPIHAPPRPGDIRYSRANIAKITDLLDFAPVVDFDSGLARTIDWFKSRE
ncbi:MAG: NAD-dependent epimerase/dehydratase family protein [Thiobacillus sp.]|nr:NAD-dependent epimerase/dehydratase family protein [Thiobacillus sp.]